MIDDSEELRIRRCGDVAVDAYPGEIRLRIGGIITIRIPASIAEDVGERMQIQALVAMDCPARNE
jgi:hypothetical protein